MVEEICIGSELVKMRTSEQVNKRTSKQVEK